MVVLYLVLAAAAAVLAVVILSFLGPEHSEKPFWRTVQRIRAVLDRISYYAICAMAVGMAGLVTAAIAASLIRNYQEHRNLIGLIVTAAIVGIVAALAAVCVRALVRDRKKGVRCECAGDCGKCRIQCRTNPNYYGLAAQTGNPGDESKKRETGDGDDGKIQGRTGNGPGDADDATLRKSVLRRALPGHPSEPGGQRGRRAGRLRL